MICVASTFRNETNSEFFFRKFLPNQSDTFYFRADFFFHLLAGTAFGLLVCQPTTPAQAVIAGVTWPTTFKYFSPRAKTRGGR